MVNGGAGGGDRALKAVLFVVAAITACAVVYKIVAYFMGYVQAVQQLQGN